MVNIFLTHKEPIDLKNVPEVKKLAIVSFKIEILDKYKNDSAYKISLNNGAGILECSSQLSSWDLQIDVGTNHVSTFLYCLGSLPTSEIDHFMKFNIYPIELSNTANNRWRLGIP